MADQRDRQQTQKMILILSVTINAILLVIFFAYLFTSVLDWIVLKKSGPRMCNDKYYSYGIKQSQDGKDLCGLMDKLGVDR